MNCDKDSMLPILYGLDVFSTITVAPKPQIEFIKGEPIMNFDILYKELNRTNPMTTPKVEKVIYNNPATIIIFDDGTKSVSKVDAQDTYDKTMGFLLAYVKRFCSHREFKRMIKEYIYD